MYGNKTQNFIVAFQASAYLIPMWRTVWPKKTCVNTSVNINHFYCNSLMKKTYWVILIDKHVTTYVICKCTCTCLSQLIWTHWYIRSHKENTFDWNICWLYRQDPRVWSMIGESSRGWKLRGEQSRKKRNRHWPKNLQWHVDLM